MKSPEEVKVLADGMAISITVGSVMEWLPAVAAALSIMWTMIRIYETKTVQRLINRTEEE